MTICRSVRLIGAAYILIALSGFLAYPFSAGILLLALHLLIGIQAVVASRHALSAVKFTRKVAVLLGTLALVEFYLPWKAWFAASSAFGGTIAVMHLATALLAAYYGYYWTNAVVEGDQNSTKAV